MTRAPSICALLLFALSAPACSSPPNSLTGSLSEIYTLDFDGTDIVLISDFIVIEYTEDSGPPEDQGKIVKLSLETTGLTITPAQSIDLTVPAMMGGSPRGTLQRITDQTLNLPMTIGTVVFDQVPTAGANLSGHFTTTLASPATGRTLNGTFLAVPSQQ